MPDTNGHRRCLVEYCKRLYDRGLVGGTQGNVSLRIDSEKIFITPTGSNLGDLKPADLAVVTLSGKTMGRLKPSSELPLHLGIYNARKDIKAICHAHPLAATAIAITKIKLDKPILPEIILTFGTIPVIEYGAPGTNEVFKKMAGVVQNANGFILQNHGAVTLGKNLDEAFNRMEMLERYAQTLILAKNIGPIQPLTKKQVNQIAGRSRPAAKPVIKKAIK